MMQKSDQSRNLLREVARMYTRAQRAVADCCRATSTQCHLLTELSRSGPLSLSELGSRVMLEKSWISRAVDTMVERGLLRKDPNPNDARSWIVSLTADGKRTARDLDRTLEAHAERLLFSLSPRERTSVEKSLVLLLNALREDAGAPAAGQSSAECKEPSFS